MVFLYIYIKWQWSVWWWTRSHVENRLLCAIYQPASLFLLPGPRASSSPCRNLHVHRCFPFFPSLKEDQEVWINTEGYLILNLNVLSVVRTTFNILCAIRLRGIHFNMPGITRFCIVDKLHSASSESDHMAVPGQLDPLIPPQLALLVALDRVVHTSADIRKVG